MSHAFQSFYLRVCVNGRVGGHTPEWRAKTFHVSTILKTKTDKHFEKCLNVI